MFLKDSKYIGDNTTGGAELHIALSHEHRTKVRNYFQTIDPIATDRNAIQSSVLPIQDVWLYDFIKS